MTLSLDGEYRVERLRQVEAPNGFRFWSAILTIGGDSYPIECRGGWTIIVGDDRRHLKPEVAEFVHSLIPKSGRRVRR